MNNMGNTYGTSVSGNCGDNKQEVEGDDELEGEGLAGFDAGRGESNTAGHEGMEDGLEGEGGTDGTRDLGGDVTGDVGPGEVAQRGEGKRQGRVQVRPRDVSRRQDDDHHRQPRACRIPDQGLSSHVLLVHYGPRRRREYQDERPYELRSYLHTMHVPRSITHDP